MLNDIIVNVISGTILLIFSALPFIMRRVRSKILNRKQLIDLLIGLFFLIACISTTLIFAIRYEYIDNYIKILYTLLVFLLISIAGFFLGQFVGSESTSSSDTERNNASDDPNDKIRK